jgi:secreted trypsin-like serine protease
LGLFPTPAEAVTYGDFVDSPQVQYPEVVPVWVGGSLCSGTLIEQQIVLTAAHCVYGQSGPIQIAVGGSTLNSGRLIDVNATWYHPRYDSTYLQNDIAVLHLRQSAGVSRLASLPAPRAKKPKNFTMAGWGRDQNGLLTGKLSALNLNEQDAASAKAFKSEYNPRTMIGAGRFFADEALYGGGCTGDSGGPLYQGRNGSTRIVIGVTSWGAEGCVRYKPTIYTWVTYYVPELLVAISQVKDRAIQNPLPPGRATPPGVGPTTTTAAPTTTTTIRRTPATITTAAPTTTTTILQTTTTTTTILQTTTTTTTIPRTTTTTTRAISPLSIILDIEATVSEDTSTYKVRLRFSTDATALPQRVCWTVMVNGNAVSNIIVTTADLNGPEWTDSGGGCATYVRSTREWGDSYWAYMSFQYRGASYNPIPYVPRTWTVRAIITDSLGRTAETSTFTRNI